MVLDRNLVTYVFSPSKATHGVTDIHLLTNPPTLETSYQLLHASHPDHYGVLLASPTESPGEIIFGEVQIPGGLEVGRGDKAIVLHNPEEIVAVADNICRYGFRFDWYFEWEGKRFKWSRNCIAGIMKSMTLTYIPAKEYKDDPPVTLALFSPSPFVTLLDYNFPRLPIKDVKGFEVIILLFTSLFIDVIKCTQIENNGLSHNEVKKETQRLQKLEAKAEEKMRRRKQEEIDRETERLRKLSNEEYMEKKRLDEQIAAETERLRWQEGFYGEKPPLPARPETPRPRPQNKKKKWWVPGNTSTNGQREIYHGKNGEQYTVASPGSYDFIRV